MSVPRRREREGPVIRVGARELTAPRYSTLPRDLEHRIIPGTRVLGDTLEVCEELAQGGTAVVYRAIDHDRGGMEVALKVVTAEADRAVTQARFENEARLGASLVDHPNVVQPLRVGRLDGPSGFEGRMFLLTELVRGVSLDVIMGQRPTGLPFEQACSIARDVALALVDLHERGVVHRDIKPGNVLIADDDGRAKLADFGLAYATGDGWEEKSPDLTEDGYIPGTPLYMAPEAIGHERPAPGFDVYSFGVMLYELLAGDPPYAKLALSALVAHKCDPERVPYSLASLCPELPDGVARLVHRCMEYSPDERPDALEVLATLEQALDAPPPMVVTATSRRSLLVPLAVLGAAVCGAALYWIAAQLGAEDIRPQGGSPELTSASYAKVGADTASEPAERAVAPHYTPAPAEDVQAPEDSPPGTTKAKLQKNPKPTAPVSRGSSRPPTTDRRLLDPVKCEDSRRDAQGAAKGARWRNVLRLTKDKRCWDGAHASERQKLRTWAFLETERFAECVSEGKGATDTRVVRWTVICNERAEAQ